MDNSSNWSDIYERAVIRIMKAHEHFQEEGGPGVGGGRGVICFCYCWNTAQKSL